MTDRSPDWYPTAYGNDVWLLEPERSTIDIRDIAKALSCQTRFAGHLREGVWCHSVAHHSVIVSHVCEPEHALIGLLHDAPEAYLQDLIRPLKHGVLGVSGYRTIEAEWALRIGEEFELGGLLSALPEDVKRADERVLATEVRDLAPALRDDQQWCDVDPLPWRIEWHAPAMAYAAFMARFRFLTEVK